MRVQFACPSCRTVLQAAAHPGATVACPRCGQHLRLTPPPRRRTGRLLLCGGAGAALLLAVAGGTFFFLPRTQQQPAAIAQGGGANPPPAAHAPADKVVAPAEDTPPAPPGDPPPAPADGIVNYPADGQKHVPRSFPGHEEPDPAPEARGAAAGYPVTASFPAGMSGKEARVTLRDADGREVEAWASSPERPANPAFAWAQQNTICAIAKKPLAPAAAYAVHAAAEVDGKAWSRDWTFTTAGEEEGQVRAVKAFAQRLNDYRKAAGAPPAVSDADLSAPCLAHARYLEKNFDQNDLNWNDEDSRLPGYTDAGRDVARRSSVNVGAGAAPTADWAVGSFITRMMTLDPRLVRLGVAAFPHQAGGFIWVIDAQGGRDAARRWAEPVLFPGPNQADVPAAYPAGDGAVPVPNPDEKAPPGYAVTALFPPGAAVEDVEGGLTDDAGKEVEAYFSSRAHPALPRFPQHAIALVPKAPLHGDACYTVSLSAKVGGEAWRKVWSFRTGGDSGPSDDALAAAALAALNVYRHTVGLPPAALDAELSKGCRSHAVYLVKNIDRPAVQGLGMHEEDASLPGATPEGRRAGKRSVITVEPEADAAVDGWMNTLYHRVPLLNPDLKKIGYGCARLPDQTWVCVLDPGIGK